MVDVKWEGGKNIWCIFLFWWIKIGIFLVLIKKNIDVSK